MATNYWISGAPEIAEVRDYLFGGTWEAGDLVKMAIGNVAVQQAAGSTVITTIIDSLVAAWNALSEDAYPAFSKCTASRSGNHFRLTKDADWAGEPIKCTLSTTESDGSAADAQTIDSSDSSAGTASTANSGPYCWDVADNWSLDAVPVATDDVVFDGRSNAPVKYGLDQNGVALASLTFMQSYAGSVGLPTTNQDITDSPYAECLPTYLAIRPGVLRIGDGEGTGAGSLRIDTGSAAAVTVVIVNTGSTRAEAGVPVVLLKGANASNSYTILRGDVGIAYHPGETANLSGGCSIGRVTDSHARTDSPLVYLGAGCTLGTVTIDSGTVWTNSAITTLVFNGGVLYHQQGAIGTITMEVGTLYYRSASAITTATILSGTAFINAAITTLTLGFDGPTVEVNGQVTTLIVNSGTMVYASSSTIAACTTNGGTVETNGAITTLTVHGGTHRHLTGAVDTLVIDGGTVHYNATGTLGGNPVVAGEGVLDFSEVGAAKTVTNPIEVYGGKARVLDPNQTVSNLRLDLNYDQLDGDRFDLGRNIRLTRGTPA